MHQAAGLHQLVSDGDARPHDVVGRLGDLEADQAIQAGRGSVRKGVLDGTGRYASALMATLDSLPPDERAVLQLVLQRGRSYDEIAEMLSIDRAAVRDRALRALDALGPQTRVDDQQRHLITDYLLGQLPEKVADTVRERLGGSASERAWARVVASELASISAEPLPEIPVGEVVKAAEAPTEQPQEEPEALAASKPPPDVPEPERPSSRVGGAILLGIGALIAIVVVVILIASGGSKKKTNSTAATTSTPTAASSTPTAASSTATSSTTPAQVTAQINLMPPNGGKSAGIAEVLKKGNTNGIAIVAQGLTPNSKHDAYAVWLFKPPSQSKLLGYVNPPVSTNGRLQTAGGLPSDAGQYTELLVTIETQRSPHGPGKIVLQGALKVS
jgi:hypothetical protein